MNLSGGDKRSRTADLLTASQTLYQLSYTPRPIDQCNCKIIMWLSRYNIRRSLLMLDCPAFCEMLVCACNMNICGNEWS